MTIRPTYEVSSEGAVRHWEVPWARMLNATPTPTDPVCLISVLRGTALTGTTLVTDTTRLVSVVDFTNSMVYRHNIRNVTTYGGGFETVWAAINIGDPVYYDDSATMPADYHLSLSPANNLAAANALFGFIVAADDTDAALFPLGGVVAASLPNVAVLQKGA